MLLQSLHTYLRATRNMLALLLTGQLLALWSRIKPFLTRTRESMEAPKSIITMLETTNLHVNRMRGGDTYRYCHRGK